MSLMNGDGKKAATAIVTVAAILVAGGGGIVFAFANWLTNTVLENREDLISVQKDIAHETANRTSVATGLLDKINALNERLDQEAREERYHQWRERNPE